MLTHMCQMKVGEAFVRVLTMTPSFVCVLCLLIVCKFGRSIFYKSRLQSTKGFPDRRENNGVKLTVNRILYVLHKCTSTHVMMGWKQKCCLTISNREERFSQSAITPHFSFLLLFALGERENKLPFLAEKSKMW